MNNALQMFTMSDLFKSDSLTSKQRSAEPSGTKSFDSIYQSKTYQTASSTQDSFLNRKPMDASSSNAKETNGLSAARNHSSERRNLVKPDKPEIKESKPDVVESTKANENTATQESNDGIYENKMKKKIDAMKKVLKQVNDEVDQAVQNGTMSSEQANVLKAALASLEEQLTALENASNSGLVSEEKAGDVLDKLQSGMSKMKHLEIELFKSGNPHEELSSTENTSDSNHNKSSFDQVLKNLTEVVDQITEVTKAVQANVKAAQEPLESKLEQSAVTESQVVGKVAEESAKKSDVDQTSVKSTSVDGTDSKEFKTLVSNSTATPATPAPEASNNPKTDLNNLNSSNVQAIDATAQNKNGQLANVSTNEEGATAKGQKNESDVTIKQVDVAKFENTLVQTAKTEAPQAMKRFESNIMQQIQNMMQNSVKIVKSGNSEMVIRLKPENLGNVSLKLNMDGGNLSAEFKVENLMVKAMIESNMTDLKNALTEKGYNVSGFDVSLGQNGDKSTGQQADQGQQRRFQNFGRDSENGKLEKTAGFDGEMLRQPLDDRSSVINSLG